MPDAHADNTPPPDDRRRRIARGAAATLAGQLATLALTVAATAALARILDPADFGLVAMVTSLLLFVGSFRDFGLPMASLQAGQLSHHHASALFWINLPLALAVAALVAALGPALAWFYGEPRLTPLAALMCLGVLAPAAANQHEAMLTRQLRFAALVKYDLAARAASVAAAIALALAGFGYWALAAQYVLWQVGRAAAVVALARWRPAPRRDTRDARREVRHLLAVGGYLTGYRVLAHAGRDLDRVLVGYLSGAHALGLYDAAFKWARLPVAQVFTPLLGPAVATLSHHREDPDAYRRSAHAVFTPVVAAAFFALAYAAVAAEPLIRVLLGDKWLDAISLFRWLCLGAIALAASKTTKWVYVSLGQTRRQFRWGLVASPVFAIAIAVGALYGPLGVAIGFTAAQWLLLAPALAVCLHRTPLTLAAYAAILARPATAAAAAAAAAHLLMRQLPPEPLAQILATAPAFAAAYAAAWLGLPGGPAAARQALHALRDLRRQKAAPKPTLAV